MFQYSAFRTYANYSFGEGNSIGRAISKDKISRNRSKNPKNKPRIEVSEQKVSILPGLSKPGTIFSFRPNQPHAQDNNGSNTQTPQPTPEPTVARKFKFAWVLIANCLACLHSIKEKESPQDRPRINHPPAYMVFTDKDHEDVANRIPRATDLG